MLFVSDKVLQNQEMAARTNVTLLMKAFALERRAVYLHRLFHIPPDLVVNRWASITASATLYPFSLAHDSSRRTERSRGDLDCLQYRGEHRPRLLPEKALRRGRAVRTREEKVMHSRQACTLSRVVQASQLMVPQREVPVAPFYIGAGALEHLRERLGLVLELVLLHRAQRIQGPTGLKQWGTETPSQRTKRRAFGDRPRRGHALERAGGNEMGVHGVGHRWRKTS